jgi:hypothetical protein
MFWHLSALVPLVALERMTLNVSCWRWWWRRPLSRKIAVDGDLGHPEDDVAAVAHHLGADF